MKVNFYTTLMGVVAVIFGVSSCKKETINNNYGNGNGGGGGKSCYTCYERGYSYDRYTYCQNDFGSRQQFTSYIQYLRNNGYVCK